MSSRRGRPRRIKGRWGRTLESLVVEESDAWMSYGMTHAWVKDRQTPSRRTPPSGVGR